MTLTECLTACWDFICCRCRNSNAVVAGGGAGAAAPIDPRAAGGVAASAAAAEKEESASGGLAASAPPSVGSAGARYNKYMAEAASKSSGRGAPVDSQLSAPSAGNSVVGGQVPTLPPMAVSPLGAAGPQAPATTPMRAAGAAAVVAGTGNHFFSRAGESALAAAAAAAAPAASVAQPSRPQPNLPPLQIPSSEHASISAAAPVTDDRGSINPTNVMALAAAASAAATSARTVVSAGGRRAGNAGDADAPPVDIGAIHRQLSRNSVVSAGNGRRDSTSAVSQSLAPAPLEPLTVPGTPRPNT